MVTLIAFNVRIFIESNKYEIDKVFDIPDGENSVISNNIVTIDTYSPSAVDKYNRIKGGVFLDKLKEKNSVHGYSNNINMRKRNTSSLI